MAISHDPQWAKQADEATKRRQEENKPWAETRLCGCNRGTIAHHETGMCLACFIEAQ